MRKDDIREAIRKLEPDNPVITDMRATHSTLNNELKRARGRSAAADRAAAKPCVLAYRQESRDILSFKMMDPDTNEPLTSLRFGNEIHQIDDIVPDDTGRALRVVSYSDQLAIMTGDLRIREEFDPARVYLTPNGTKVRYKRDEDGLVHLWSFKKNDEIGIGANIELQRTDTTAKPTAAKQLRKTQKIIAAWLIANNPNITGPELTTLLRKEFPANNIGARHGPHYLCLSRNGKLPEPPDEDPREWPA